MPAALYIGDKERPNFNSFSFRGKGTHLRGLMVPISSMKTVSQSRLPSLWSLPRNSLAIVKQLSGDLGPVYRQRLCDFGISEGSEVLCLRHSLWGGPRVYQVGGLTISFEKKIAELIAVEAR